MNIRQELEDRSQSCCELCEATGELHIYNIPPYVEAASAHSILLCKICLEQLENKKDMSVAHWYCLKKSAWSQIAPIQVIAWRILNQLKNEDWALSLMESLYLEPETLEWAKSATENLETIESKHIDSNGVELSGGDTVVIIKDLNVKGGGFTAKRGTAVRNISLVQDNPEQIEGRVNGQKIVILTKFVKKS